MTMLAELEGTGEKFSLDSLLDVRARTRQARLASRTAFVP